MRGLGFGFTNPVEQGKCVCFGCGGVGVGGEWAWTSVW